MKVWKIVKKTLPFFGTRPFLAISSGLMRTKAFSSKAAKEVKSLKAWSARLLRSARNRMRGLRIGSPEKFHLAENSFHAISKAMAVFPVPVASVNRIRVAPSQRRSSALLAAFA